MNAPRRAKQPLTALAGPYGHPWHPAVVPLPIGAWLCSFLFDLAGVWAPGADWLAPASRWLIAIGVLGALAAASLGFLDLAAIPSGTAAFRTALLHMTLNLSVTVAFGVNFALRGEAAPGIGLVVLSAISLTALAAAGYLGGKLAYRYGVRVAADEVQAGGFVTNQSARTSPRREPPREPPPTDPIRQPAPRR